jgi:hypothetical protein
MECCEYGTLSLCIFQDVGGLGRAGKAVLRAAVARLTFFSLKSETENFRRNPNLISNKWISSFDDC